jgi:uncharacterized protein
MAFLPETWYDPRLALGPSAVHGTGLLATADIAEGDLVMEWGGTAYRVADLAAGRVPPSISYAIVDEDVLLAGPAGDMDYFVNHSCDPNVWLDGGLRIVARRAIPAGTEIVGDYATWESEPDYVLTDCRCGAAVCRGMVAGTDWQQPDLRRRYRGHFLPFLERRIAAAAAE